MTKKRVLILVGAFLLIFGMICCIILVKKEPEPIGSDRETIDGTTPEDVAKAFTIASYEGDVESIIKMMPGAWQDRMFDDSSEFYDLVDETAVIEHLSTEMLAYLTQLDGSFGEGWEYVIEVDEPVFYSAEEIEDLNNILRLMRVEYTATEASTVPVSVYFTAINGTTGSTDFYVPVVKSDESWNLGQYIGAAAPEDQTYQLRFGDLMDGFAITGYIDENGNFLEYGEGEVVDDNPANAGGMEGMP